MNGKQAKLLRKCGLVDKSEKKQYYSLNHINRGMLTRVLKMQRRQKQTQK